MESINLDLKISNILEEFPETFNFFKENGLNMNSKDLKDFLSLRNFFEIFKLNEKKSMEFLNKLVRKEEKDENQIFKEKILKKESINFTGHAALLYENSIKAIVSDFASKNNINLNLNFFSKKNKNLFKTYIQNAKSSRDLPDILFGKGMSFLINKKFINTFIKKGIFNQNKDYDLKENFKNSKISDKSYIIIGAMPIILLIDKRKIGNLAIPKKWSDLMKDIYKNQISILGYSGNDYFSLLIYFYKEYGIEGVKKICDSIKKEGYSSKTSMETKRSSLETNAINIMYKFSDSFLRKDYMELINLEEGILLSPIFCLAKAKSRYDLSPIINAMLSKDVGEVLVNTGFISSNPNVENLISDDIKLNWISWDYLEKNDTEELNKMFKKISNET